MKVFEYTPGSSPVIMSIPHLGENLPEETASLMTDAGREVADTDWWLDRLYNFTDELGFSILRPMYSRYLIDLNRDPQGKPLYPGADNTELVPTSTFYEQPIYLPGKAPDAGEVERRRKLYWQPYHDRLEQAVRETKEQHGIAIVFDCHSIGSVVPRFFEGKLPDFNIGTGAGITCSVELTDRIKSVLEQDNDHSLAINGRFKGGYITRHYGDPEQNVHAFQMELSYATYLDEKPPVKWREDLAETVRPSLQAMLQAVQQWAEEQ